MDWDKHITQLTLKYAPNDFSVPFSQASDILKNIERRFIIKNNAATHFNYWSRNIKHPSLITTILLKERTQFLQALGDANFWIVLIPGSYPGDKHLVYNCTLRAIDEVLAITPYDFFIVDKKYTWFVYFHPELTTQQLSIFQSGNAPHPFSH